MLHSYIKKHILEFNSKEKEDLKGFGLSTYVSKPTPSERQLCILSLFSCQKLLATQSVSKGNTNLFFQENCLLPNHF